MEVQNRTRIISFRVTEEEFQALKAFSAANGIRSISELARCALQEYVSANTVRTNDVEERIRWITGRLSLLDRAVERLAQLVESYESNGRMAAGQSF